MKKILFTGGGGAGSEAIWKSLNIDYEIFFADAMFHESLSLKRIFYSSLSSMHGDVFYLDQSLYQHFMSKE